MKNVLRLTFLAPLFGLVVACSGAPAPTGTGQPEQKGRGAKKPGEGGGEASNGQTAGNNAGKPGGTNAGKPGEGKADPGEPGEGEEGGEPGQPGRISVNGHCCYGAKYYKCPDSAACFGGFDVDVCLDACNGGPGDACWEECFDKLSNAPAPKGCQTNVTPPKGIDCANGQINGG
jgi:hypothetical protein